MIATWSATIHLIPRISSPRIKHDKYRLTSRHACSSLSALANDAGVPLRALTRSAECPIRHVPEIARFDSPRTERPTASPEPPGLSPYKAKPGAVPDHLTQSHLAAAAHPAGTPADKERRKIRLAAPDIELPAQPGAKHITVRKIRRATKLFRLRCPPTV
jgi:hypothetical protein